MRKKKNIGRKAGRVLCRSIVFACSFVLGTEVLFVPPAVEGVSPEAALAERIGAGPVLSGLIQCQKSYEEKLAEAEARRKALEEKKAELEQQIRENEKKKDDLLAYIEVLDGQIMELNDDIEALDKEIAEAEAELVLTRADLKEAQQREKEQYEAMKKRIQYMYENGEKSVFELFFGAANLSDLLNRMEYQKKITEYDQGLLTKYTESKCEVEVKKQLLEAELDELAAMKETAEFNRSTLEELACAKSLEIEAYLAQIELDEDTFADYAEEITRENANIEEIKEEERKRIEEEERRRREEEERRRKEEEERRRKAAEAAAAAKAAAEQAEKESDAKRLAAADNVKEKDVTDPDKMIWPLPGDGRIYSYFGPRKAPIAGASTYHRGLDIGGVTGARIVSVLSGTVIEAGYNSSRGNYVVVDHGNGLVTYYMHCSKLIASKGDKVKQGTVIGLVGTTGISTGPHLHFSLTVNGVYVDPLKYVNYSAQ